MPEKQPSGELLPTAAGHALLAARTRLGLSQRAFAARLATLVGHPVAPTQVAKWERGYHRPRPPILAAASQLLGIPADQLSREGILLRAAPRPEPASPSPARSPKAQLTALLRFGFSLSEAIELVDQDQARQRARSGVPEEEGQKASSG